MSQRRNFTLRWLLTACASPLLLLGLATSEFLMGGNALSHWSVGVATKTGLGIDRTVRLLIAVQLVAAGYALLYPGIAPAIAWATFGALAFSGLAELSSLIGAPGTTPLPGDVWVMPLASLTIGGAGLLLLGRRTEHGQASAPHGIVTPWRLFLGLFVLGGALSIAARVVVTERTTAPLMRAAAMVPIATRGSESVMLNPQEWVGHTIPETGLGRLIPELTAATLEGTKWIVFYQPSCGRCHEIFRVYFKGPQAGQTIAVVVPHAPDEEVLPSDQPADVECQDCLRLSLPEGKRWIITTPTIVKVEDGRITCATWTDYDRCRPASDALP